MAEKSRYLYWDSNVFISFINEDPDRIDTIIDLWDEISTSKDDRIITSSISIAEVAYASAEILGEPPNQGVEDKIEEIWTNPTVLVVESPEIVMRIARTLMRDARAEGHSLKPYDAVHLGTAMWVHEHAHRVDEFHTYDNLDRYAILTGLKICEPSIIQPKLV